MAPIDKKRKGGPTNESFARSRNPTDGESRPSKRPRAEEQEGEKLTKAKIPHAPKISQVRDEDAAFPRGGDWSTGSEPLHGWASAAIRT